jgi:hypothetical protein
MSKITVLPACLLLLLVSCTPVRDPFTVFYDDRSREWRQVSLIPIMPSFSYSHQSGVVDKTLSVRR